VFNDRSQAGITTILALALALAPACNNRRGTSGGAGGANGSLPNAVQPSTPVTPAPGVGAPVPNAGPMMGSTTPLAGGAGTGGAAAPQGTAGMTPPSSSNAVTYNKDIRPVIETHCLECHVAGGIGPFALDSYAAVNMVAGQVASAVMRGIMPPWPASSACNPLIDDRSLLPADKDLFAAWQAGGFLEGDPSQYVKPKPLEQISPSGAPSVMFAAGGTYTPQPSSDEYRCFVMGTVPKDMYFSGMAIIPGVRAEVHHAQIHRISPDQWATVQNADSQDPALGYACTTTFGVTPQIMFSYRPGSLGISFPEGDAGFIPAGSGLIVQIHYNTVFLPAGTSPQPDETKIAFWTLPDGKLPDRIVYRTTVWGTSDLPAGNAHVVTTTTTPMRALSSFDSTSPLGVSNGPFGVAPGSGAPAPAASATFVPGEIVGITPHAHQLATRLAASLKPAGSSSDVCLVDVPRWDFGWQFDYLLQKGVPYSADDTLSATCEWDNSAANQPVIDGVKQAPMDVTFGERSVDEMCQHWIWLRFDRKAFLTAIGK
jgi:hypothetical protein